MARLAWLTRHWILAFAAALVAGCGGSSETDEGSNGGSQATGGSSGRGGGGGSVMSGAGGSAQGGASGAAQGGASGAAQGGTGGLECGAGCIRLCEGGMCDCYCEASCEGFAAPPFDKSCQTDGDCFAGVHIRNCCGSQQVLGYNTAEMSRFQAYEADCAARAACLCPQEPPILEGGQVTADIEQRFAQCAAGQCLGNGPVNVGQ